MNLSTLIEKYQTIERPEVFLGPNWKDVLNFWLYFDTLSPEQLNRANELFWNLNEWDRIAASELAWRATCATTGFYYNVDIFENLTTDIGEATLELIGSHKILEQGKPLTFVPLFLDL
jgi:hypothetical protein